MRRNPQRVISFPPASRWLTVLVLSLAVLLAGSPAVAAGPDWGSGAGQAANPQASSPAPRAGGSFLGDVGSSIKEDLSGRLPAEFASELAERGGGKLLGTVLGSVMPPGLGKIAGEFLGNLAWKVGYDGGSNLYRHATQGEALKKIDWGEAAAAATGATVLGVAFSAVLGPTIGGTLGAYLGWSLGEAFLKEWRSGQPFSLSRVLKNADLPRTAVEAFAVMGGSWLAGSIMGSSMMAAVAGSALGGPLALVLRVGLASVAVCLADTIYDRVAERFRAEDPWPVPPGTIPRGGVYTQATPASQATATSEGAVDGAGLRARVDETYRTLLRTQASRRPGDPAITEAQRAYSQARTAFESARRGAARNVTASGRTARGAHR